MFFLAVYELVCCQLCSYLRLEFLWQTKYYISDNCDNNCNDNCSVNFHYRLHSTHTHIFSLSFPFFSLPLSLLFSQSVEVYASNWDIHDTLMALKPADSEYHY